tara:strand:+ start:41846 stop:42307 length:462 start_codon:yes stop_codon:yes gene_type:complete
MSKKTIIISGIATLFVASSVFAASAAAPTTLTLNVVNQTRADLHLMTQSSCGSHHNYSGPDVIKKGGQGVITVTNEEDPNRTLQCELELNPVYDNSYPQNNRLRIQTAGPAELKFDACSNNVFNLPCPKGVITPVNPWTGEKSESRTITLTQQ